MDKPRILVWFSCGAASAVAAKETIRLYDSTHEVVIVCCDTRPSEHSDNYRFSAECEKWFGRPITYIRNDKFRTVDEVFMQRRYMSGQQGAVCTTQLKKMPRHEFATTDDLHVFGYTAEEKKRSKRFIKNNPELHLIWPLIKLGITKAECHRRIAEAGIDQAAMYKLGFTNNNCPGCVKSSSPWYWDMIRKHFPDVFLRRCQQSRELGVRLVEIRHHKRIFLDELPWRKFKKYGKKENLSCGPECGSVK